VADTWGTAKWDTGEWQGAAPPSQDLGADWRWWYQTANTVNLELNGLVVEAVWSTDSHTLGDGTFRGDLQPGTLTLRLWDPGHALDGLDRHGAVWAVYKPTGAAWCWFYDSLTRGLYPAGDPADADCVYTGTPWPARLTGVRTETNFPAQSAAARMAAIVNVCNTTGDPLTLPTVTGAIAAQSQIVAAAPAQSPFGFPGILESVRDAATNGVAWWTPVAAATGPGTLTLNYARWETANARPLDRSQVIAGPPTTAAMSFFAKMVAWDGTTAAGATYTEIFSGGVPGPPIAGWQQLTFRLYGDATGTGGAEYNAALGTATNVLLDHSDPAEQIISTVEVQSGRRTHVDGSPATVDWDPYAHTFSPVDVAALVDNAGVTRHYHVARSDHRLTATSWQTTHTLDKYTAPAALP
jgi:hypothetical protein